MGDARFLPFQPKSFEVVVSVDLLEHIPKVDGKKLVAEMEEIATKFVLFTTPWFFFNQEALDGNPHQQHISVYAKHDFPEYEYMVVPQAGLYFKAIE